MFLRKDHPKFMKKRQIVNSNNKFRKHQKHITRLGKWVEGCRIYEDKKGTTHFTYWDIEADNFRNASLSWSIRY